MTRLRAQLSDWALDATREAAMPRHFEPMLATLSDTPFSHDDWVFERKLDGIRLLVFRNADHVELLTRNCKSLNDRFPELADVFAHQPSRRFVLDGEVVAFEGNGNRFSRLQKRAGIADPEQADPEQARVSRIGVHFYAFDCLWLDGLDLRRVPLRERKGVLRHAFDFNGVLRYTAHRNADGEAYLAEACDKGWEGILAKHVDSAYRCGRSKRWLKLKCSHGQELVSGGFTEPEGGRHGFGALLVGYYDGDALIYAGRVGAGFDRGEFERLRGALAGIERRTAPFVNAPAHSGIHWVMPERIAEIGFTEWTEGGRLRHPRYLGERDDKDAREVVRERPQA